MTKKTHYVNHDSRQSYLMLVHDITSSFVPHSLPTNPAVLHEEERNRLIVHAQQHLRDRERSSQRSNIPRSRTTVPIPIEFEAKERARPSRKRAACFIHARWKATIRYFCPWRRKLDFNSEPWYDLLLDLSSWSVIPWAGLVAFLGPRLFILLRHLYDFFLFLPTDINIVFTASKLFWLCCWSIINKMPLKCTKIL